MEYHKFYTSNSPASNNTTLLLNERSSPLTPNSPDLRLSQIPGRLSPSLQTVETHQYPACAAAHILVMIYIHFELPSHVYVLEITSLGISCKYISTARYTVSRIHGPSTECQLWFISETLFDIYYVSSVSRFGANWPLGGSWVHDSFPPPQDSLVP